MVSDDMIAMIRRAVNAAGLTCGYISGGPEPSQADGSASRTCVTINEIDTKEGLELSYAHLQRLSEELGTTRINIGCETGCESDRTHGRFLQVWL
jgi:hypothetical protein